MRYAFFLSLTLATLWLAVSGVYKPLLFGFGIASIAMVVWLSLRMEVVGVEHHPGLYFPRLIPYWGWLVRQIITANINVAKRVFNPQTIAPQVIELPVTQHTAVSRVTYANSCTLTPGTLTLEVTPNRMTVHALDEVSARDLQSGQMAEKVLWLEGMDENPHRSDDEKPSP